MLAEVQRPLLSRKGKHGPSSEVDIESCGYRSDITASCLAAQEMNRPPTVCRGQQP